MTVFCDNGDCCYIGEDGLCGCDKLSIVGGVCAGSHRSGRNACDGDVDERLKTENEKLIIKLNAEHIARQNAEVDNAKLRELVRRYVEYTSQDRCEGCVVKSRCNDGEVDECWQLTEIRGLARELGIEVE